VPTGSKGTRHVDIADYFTRQNVYDSLRSASDFVLSNNWRISERADLYVLANKAFGEHPDISNFTTLYDWLRSYWKIGRGGKMWSTIEVFDTLTLNCEDTSQQSGVNLITQETERYDSVAKAIRAMANVKLNREYPHMAASKLLHFYNPCLYPIYDGAVVWDVVLKGTFRGEWMTVCKQYGIAFTEGSERFLQTYFSWAAKIMRGADPEVMVIFANWFRAQAGKSADPLVDLDQYYAAAFEFILIGSAMRHKVLA
jgi:hypothetical protein